MPINRPDGRHWCAPEREEPDENGQWVCPDCGKEWVVDASWAMGRLWVPADQPATSDGPLSGQED